MEPESSEGYGDDLESPFTVCKAISDIVESTLGPKGLYKMIVRKTGTPVVSKDSETILDEMDIEHPAYDLVRGYTLGSDSVYMTWELILLGKLVENALELVDEGIHPTIITDAYDASAQESVERMAEMSTTRDPNEALYEKLIRTQLRSRAVFDDGNDLSGTVLDSIYDDRGERIDTDDIEIYPVPGKNVTDSVAIPGVCVDKRRPVNSTRLSLPIREAGVLLTDDSLCINESEHDVGVKVTGDTRTDFLDSEASNKEALAESISSVGCDVVFSGSRDNADPEIQQYLSDRDVAVFHQVDDEVIDKLARVTGARNVLDIHDVSEADLGRARHVGKEGIGDETYVFVEGSDPETFKTILLRGGTEQVLDTYETAVEDCLSIVDAVSEDGKVMPGGGASELHTSVGLREWADGIDNRRQLAVRAYADALESIPATLARNAGMNPVDTLIELRNRHDDGMVGYGVDGLSGDVADMYASDCIEPLSPKIRSLRVATEMAVLLLRIDGILVTGTQTEEAAVPGESPQSENATMPPQNTTPT